MISGNPTSPGPNVGGERAYYRGALSHLSASFSFGPLPFWVDSGHCVFVGDLPVCLGAVSGEESGNPTSPGPSFGENRGLFWSGILHVSSSSVCRQPPSSSAIFRSGSLLGHASASAAFPCGVGGLPVFRTDNPSGFVIFFEPPGSIPARSLSPNSRILDPAPVLFDPPHPELAAHR